MPLTPLAIKALKPAEKAYDKGDGGSLFLKVTPSGGRLWRLKYRFGGKQKTLALGAFPIVSLADARAGRDEAKRLLAQGIDPGAVKQDRKKAASEVVVVDPGNKFGQVAQEFVLKRKREGAAPATLDKMAWYMDALGAGILAKPIADVTYDDLLARLQIHEQAGALEKVARVRTFAVRVFKFGKKHVKANPALGLEDELASPLRHKHHAALLDPDDVGGLLRAIDGYRGDPSVWFILRLAPHVFLRSHEIRHLIWSDIKFETNLIRIPGERMRKGKQEHLVPLSRQSRAILEEALPWSGPKASGKPDSLIFPSPRDKSRELSENAMTGAFRRMGYTSKDLTQHGLRTTFSTWANEAGWNKDWIEMQLSHGEPNEVRGAYNGAAWLADRRRLMDWWSGELDAARARRPRKD